MIEVLKVVGFLVLCVASLLVTIVMAALMTTTSWWQRHQEQRMAEIRLKAGFTAEEIVSLERLRRGG